MPKRKKTPVKHASTNKQGTSRTPKKTNQTSDDNQNKTTVLVTPDASHHRTRNRTKREVQVRALARRKIIIDDEAEEDNTPPDEEPTTAEDGTQEDALVDTDSDEAKELDDNANNDDEVSYLFTRQTTPVGPSAVAIKKEKGLEEQDVTDVSPRDNSVAHAPKPKDDHQADDSDDLEDQDDLARKEASRLPSSLQGISSEEDLDQKPRAKKVDMLPAPSTASSASSNMNQPATIMDAAVPEALNNDAAVQEQNMDAAVPEALNNDAAVQEQNMDAAVPEALNNDAAVQEQDTNEGEEFLMGEDVQQVGAPENSEPARATANEVGLISFANDIMVLPRMPRSGERIVDRHGKALHPNRVFTAITTSGDILALFAQPKNNDTMPSSDFFAFRRMEKDSKQYVDIRKQFVFSKIVELRSAEDPTVALDGNRDKSLEGEPRRVILRVTSKQLTLAQVQTWGKNIAELMTFVACKGIYDTAYRYVGDITPPQRQPLGYYLTMEETLGVMRVRFRGRTIVSLLQDDNIARLYFGARDLVIARNEAPAFDGGGLGGDNNGGGNNNNGGNNNGFLNGLRFD